MVSSLGLVLPKLQLRDHFKETTPIYISYFFCGDTLGCPKHTFTHIFQLSSCVRAQEIHKFVIRQFNLAVLAYLGGVKNLNVEIGAGGPCSGVPNGAMRVAKQERWRRVGEEELNRGSPRTFPLDHSEP